MPKLILGSIFSLLTVFIFAQSSLPVKEIVLENGDNFEDLAFLKPLLKDKKIVLLGESSHGIGDYYTLKSRLVKYLHKELGFEVFAIESGMADVYFEYKKLDTISAVQLRNNTVYGNFQCAEVMPLFDYIKATAATPRPLIYAGFDSQNFSASFVFLKEVLSTFSKEEGPVIINDLAKYYKIPSFLWSEDKAPLFALGDTIRRAAEAAMKIIDENEAAIKSRFALSDLGMAILKRAVANHREAVTLDWEKEDPVSRRDSLMAANLFWLMEKLYPNKKVIIWGHNGHIDKQSPIGNPYKWMGHYIHEKYKLQSYHLGLFAKQGETYEWWTKSVKPFDNDQPDDIEKILSARGFNVGFIDIASASKRKAGKWLNDPVYGFEVENGGRLGFIPAQRFDGVIVCKQVRPPSY